MFMFWVVVCLLLGLPLFGVWPTISKGPEPYNALTKVIMPPKDDKIFNVQPYKGVLAQELVERWVQSALSVLVVLPIAYYLSWLPGYGIIPSVLIVFAFVMMRKPKRMMREIELVGHTVEVVFAEEVDNRWPDYAEGDALSIVIYQEAYYNNAFAGWGIDDIVSAMNKRRWLARILIKLFAMPIKRYG